MVRCFGTIFIYNNPRNPDVEDISVGELKALFPDSYITYKKVTLTPPISRFILSVALWNWIYSCFNLLFKDSYCGMDSKNINK